MIDDIIAIAIGSSASKIVTLNVACYSGHEMSSEASDLVTVEARHGHAGSWTDITDTPLSLTAYAGSTEAFEVRVTSSVITTNLTDAFRIRVGPAA